MQQKVFNNRVFRRYRRKGEAWVRPYVVGEPLDGVEVHKETTPKEGGWIAVDPHNPKDVWYISPEHFQRTYERDV